MNPKILLLVSLVTLLVLYRRWRQLRTRNVRQKICSSSLTGEKYMDELMTGSDKHVFDLIRMNREAFNRLCEHFIERGWLQDSKHIKVKEKMCMFLRTLSHNDRNRVIQDRFQHSGQTISKYFHEVLWAMLKFSKEMIVPPNFNAPVEEIHGSNRRLRETFKGAVGALDGTLIHANVPKEKQIPYRGRGGGECWQNVLAICNFNMEFLFAVAGWEGTANDARILVETIRDPENNFPTPPRGMYYLCDSAFTHTRGFMCPYKGGPRYWLPQFKAGGPARGKEEKFNHAHSKLRNVIERSFGVLKARFPILKKMPSYDLPTQRNIVIATMAIHNYLRRYSYTDDLFRQYENEDVVLEPPPLGMEYDDAPPTANDIFKKEEQIYMKALREQIANNIRG